LLAVVVAIALLTIFMNVYAAYTRDLTAQASIDHQRAARENLRLSGEAWARLHREDLQKPKQLDASAMHLEDVRLIVEIESGEVNVSGSFKSGRRRVQWGTEGSSGRMAPER
jgi:hypothetical protein